MLKEHAVRIFPCAVMWDHNSYDNEVALFYYD